MVIDRYRLVRQVDSRWFALADFASATISAGLWYAFPELGALPLLLALASWVIRLLAKRFPFQRTQFDIPLILFLLTALGAIWVAYDQVAAEEKFWIILSSIFLFYALAGQPSSNLWIIAGFFGFIGLILAIYFLLTNDWGIYPAKIEVLQQIGVRWMDIRPRIGPPAIHPNGVAGILILTIPMSFAVWHQARFQIRKPTSIIALSLAAISLTALLLTGSRGAWLALGLAAVLRLIWEVSGWLESRVRRSQILVASIFYLMLILIGIAVVRKYTTAFTDAPIVNLGHINTLDRPELAKRTLRLIEDFPFTGGGLASFPGLYSHYMLGIPFFAVIYSHNIFLDVALEQGVLAAIALIAVLSFCGLQLARFRMRAEMKSNLKPLALALLISLVAVVIHGLVSDPLYGNRGSALLFVLPGFAASLSAQASPHLRDSNLRSMRIRPITRRANHQIRIFLGSLLLLAAILVLTNLPLLRAKWFANLGAVRMAQLELEGWPLDGWEIYPNLERFETPSEDFQRALNINPVDRTANHRMGLLASIRGDYSSATSYLAKAYHADPNHRGIAKAYGYALVWDGSLDQAERLLARIPEAAEEMAVYRWWWGEQGRPDLSSAAGLMAARLD